MGWFENPLERVVRGAGGSRLRLPLLAVQLAHPGSLGRNAVITGRR
jgi:hypothetical protein